MSVVSQKGEKDLKKSKINEFPMARYFCVEKFGLSRKCKETPYTHFWIEPKYQIWEGSFRKYFKSFKNRSNNQKFDFSEGEYFLC